LLSFVFATVMTLIESADRLVEAWAPKFGQPAAVTLRVPHVPRLSRDDKGTLVPRHEGVVVSLGEVLSASNEAHARAVAFERLRRPPSLRRIAGAFAIFLTLGLGLTGYLRKFGQNRLKLLRAQAGVLTAMAALCCAGKLLLLATSLPAFWIPVAAVPLWVATSFDRRTGFVAALVLALAVSAFVDFDVMVLCILMARGMAGTLLYGSRRTPRQMITAGGLSGLSAALLYVAVAFVLERAFDPIGDIQLLLGSELLACVGGGLLAGVLSAGLRAPAARVLGHVSRERLLDLTDLEQPLLKKLAIEAPGTFEHSRAMANLAEQAASSIGADALLTRVGAYYHDLGKTAQAKYFVENLGSDERSPHDELDPEVSADAIMAHVVVGTKLLRQGGMPEPVVEFAYTHHGTQVVEYFWNKCLAQGNPKNLDSSAFRYPGMKPQTKETAILMLVDSIEAASRTIDPPEREQFEMMVQRVIFTKLKQAQLDDCGLNLNELKIIANRTTDTLVNMHHHRIKYQWQAKRAEEFGVPSQAIGDSLSNIPVSKQLKG
jgi:hypothetical protein